MTDVAAAVVIFLMSMGVTLNPDGSGKAVVEITQSPRPSPNAAKTPETVKEFAQRMLRPEEGVDAWSDVAVGTTAEGLLTFKGTVYFKDLGHLRPVELPLTWAKDPKGGMVLEVRVAGGTGKPAPAPANLTEEGLDKAVEAARAEWRQRLPMMEQMGKSRLTYSFKLPGTVEEVGGLKKVADGTLLFESDMNKNIKALGQLIADEAYLRNTIKAGLRPAMDSRDPVFMDKVFGTKSQVMAHVTGDLKPQFDYAAEVKAAQEAAPKMMEKLGLSTEAAKAAK